jgi:hypothetical protein
LEFYDTFLDQFLHEQIREFTMKIAMIFSLAFALAGASAASASTIYGFSGTWNIPTPPTSGSGTFTLTVATPPLLDTIYTPGAQLTCSSCTQVEFIPDTVADGFTPPSTPAQAILYTTTLGGIFFYFAPDTFTTLGTHNTFLLQGITDGTLSVSAGVPEPSALGLSLLGSALLFAAGLRRKPELP